MYNVLYNTRQRTYKYTTTYKSSTMDPVIGNLFFIQFLLKVFKSYSNFQSNHCWFKIIFASISVVRLNK